MAPIPQLDCPADQNPIKKLAPANDCASHGFKREKIHHVLLPLRWNQDQIKKLQAPYMQVNDQNTRSDFWMYSKKFKVDTPTSGMSHTAGILYFRAST